MGRSGTHRFFMSNFNTILKVITYNTFIFYVSFFSKKQKYMSMVTDCSWLPVTLIWIYWFVCLFVFFFFFFYYSQFVALKIVAKVVFFYVVIGHKIFGLFYLSLFCYGRIIIYYGALVRVYWEIQCTKFVNSSFSHDGILNRPFLWI